MTLDKYILDGHTHAPELCDDVLEWGAWFDAADRVVAKTEVAGVEVSTVFLGIDHQWGDGPPMLFETMIFGGGDRDRQWRYSTWEEAEAGHNKIVSALEKGTMDL